MTALSTCSTTTSDMKKKCLAMSMDVWRMADEATQTVQPDIHFRPWLLSEEKKSLTEKVYETLLHDLRPQASTCFSINQLQSQVRDSAQSLWIPELYGCLGFKMLQASPVTTGTTPSHATEAILQDYHVPYMAWVGGWGSTGFSRSRSSILQV
jgi:hypothetical protein